MLARALAKLIATKQGKGNDLVYQTELIDEVISHNSRLVKQQLDKGLKADLYNQTIKCVELIKVNALDCSIDVEESVLRTKERIPKPIQGMYTPFVSVYNSVNGKLRTEISYIRLEEVSGIPYRTYTANSIFYTYDDGYIFILNTSILKTIAVRSPFDNPFSVLDFQSGCGVQSDCFQDGDLIISEYNTSQILQSFTNGRAEV